MTTESISTITSITKIQYSHPICRWIAFTDNPRFAQMKKMEDWVGGPGASNTGTGSYAVPLQIESQQPGGVTVPIAQAGLFPSQYVAFMLPRLSDYGVARIKLEVIEAASSDKGAFVNAFKREMDSALLTVKRSAAIQQTRAGTGSRGRIATTANVASSIIQLSNPADATNFNLNCPIQLSNTDGGTLRSSGANATISKIDRVNGFLMFGDILSNLIAAAQAGDYILRTGDLNAVITGMAGYIPTTSITSSAGTGTLFGVDRSVDTRLTGNFLNAGSTSTSGGSTVREALINAMNQVKVQGGKPDYCWLNPAQMALLARECEGKSIYFKEVTTDVSVKGMKAKVGYDAFEVQFAGSKMMVCEDINVQGGDAFVTQEDTWFFASLMPVPHVLTAPGTSEFFIVPTDDALEMRFAYRGNIGNDGPAYTCHVFNLPS